MMGVERFFEWDAAKASSNFLKHGVRFETATEVFDDPFAIEWFDPRSDDYGEERYLIAGVGGGALLTIVYTERNDNHQTDFSTPGDEERT